VRPRDQEQQHGEVHEVEGHAGREGRQVVAEPVVEQPGAPAAIPPPFAVMVALEGVSSTTIRVGPHLVPSQAEPVQYEPVAVLPDVLISDYGTAADYHHALRPMFDALWNMAGRRRAATFDANGKWTPRG
jgi:hypothetical protein